MRKTSEHTICFLMPALGQPRWSKRIAMLKSEGFTVKALAFERDYHKGRLPDCEIHMLGSVAKGQYLKRLIVLAKAIPTLRRHTRHTSAVYAFGLDLTILALAANLFRKSPVFLEVGDIRPIQVAAGLKGKFMKFLSQKTFNLSSLLIVTSEDFVSGYYADGNVSETPWLVLENKMDAPAQSTLSNGSITDSPQSKVNSPPTKVPDSPIVKPSAPTARHAESDVMKIGYFGVLRSPWSFNTLAAYASDNSESVKIIVAGALQEGHKEFERLIALDNVEYLGAYRSPVDLPRLYKQVDLVWGCYPEPATAQERENKAWLWAQAVCRSNRFYESCFYKIPIISMADSSDGKVVKQWNLGPILQTHDYSEIKRQLDAITPETITLWHDNMKNIPASTYQYSTETAELAKTVRRLINS